MVLYLAALFVIACSAFSIALAMYVIWQESRSAFDEQADEQLGVQPPWLYGPQGRRMDVPRKRPLMPTRHSK